MVESSRGLPRSLAVASVIILFTLILSFVEIRIEPIQLILVLTLVGLLLFPSIAVLRIGGILELRRDVSEVKQGQDAIKAQLFQIEQRVEQRTSVSQHLNIQLPEKLEQAAERLKQLRQVIPEMKAQPEDKERLGMLDQAIKLADGDNFIAAASLLRDLIKNLIRDIVLSIKEDVDHNKMVSDRFDDLVQKAESQKLISPILADNVLLTHRILNEIIHSYESIPVNPSRAVLKMASEDVQLLTKKLQKIQRDMVNKPV